MTQAVLLDLGNVVLGIDFHRVFRHWAAVGDVPVEQFYDHWRMDQAYKDHEVGAIGFEEYAEHLETQFAVSMSIDDWRQGWNSIWTEPFDRVVSLLPAVAERYPLYGFTNTNDTHALHWRHHFGSKLSAFEHIFVSSEIGHRKPDVSAYHHVCDAMGHAPGAVVFLDDSLENIQGATASGLIAHHVRNEAEVADRLNQLLR